MTSQVKKYCRVVQKKKGRKEGQRKIGSSQRKVKREEGLSLEEEKGMLEGNVGVGVMEDKGESGGQENTILDVGGEDGEEDNSKDMDWGRSFEGYVIRKEVSYWLAGLRREHEDNRAGQADVLELTA